MRDTIALGALVRKRADLQGLVLDCEARIVELRRQVAALDTAIKVFDPTYRPATIIAAGNRSGSRQAASTWIEWAASCTSP